MATDLSASVTVTITMGELFQVVMARVRGVAIKYKSKANTPEMRRELHSEVAERLLSLFPDEPEEADNKLISELTQSAYEALISGLEEMWSKEKK